jgi:Tfp pilus assembly PilM family ATPase
LAPSWWPARKRACLGLDLGSAAIKAVELERVDGAVELRTAAVSATPPGALTEGALTDAIAVAEGLRAMLAAQSIRTRNAAAGVGGERVLCQAEAPKGGDLAAYVRERAAVAAGYSLDAACLGWQGVGSEIEGSVVWTSAPVEQVDWVRATAALAGRAPRLIAPQACALANIYSFGYEPSGRNAALLLHVGARRALAVAMRGWAVAYSCDVAIGRQRAVAEKDLPQLLIEALEVHLEPLTASVQPYEMELVLLSGGGARSEALRESLRKRAGIDVDTLDPFRKIGYDPSGELARTVENHGPALAVAAGLALTGLGEE